MKKYIINMSLMFVLAICSILTTGCFDMFRTVSVQSSSITIKKNINDQAILTHTALPVETFFFVRVSATIKCDKKESLTNFSGTVTNAQVIEIYDESQEVIDSANISEEDTRSGTVTSISGINYNLKKETKDIVCYIKLYVNDPGTVHLSFTLNGDNWDSAHDIDKNITFVVKEDVPLQRLETPSPTRSYTNISWEKITHATDYTLVVKDDLDNTVVNNTNYQETTFSADSLTSGVTYTLEISANGDGLLFQTSETATITFTILDDLVVNVDKTDGLLKWQPVTGANKYIVYLNGLKLTISGNQTSFNISTISTDTNTIVLYAVNDENSYCSKPYTNNNLKVLKTPTITKVSDFKIEWVNIGSGVLYEIYINGVLRETVADVIAYKLPSGQNQEIKIRAISNDPNILASGFSNSITYTLA